MAEGSDSISVIKDAQVGAKFDFEGGAKKIHFMQRNKKIALLLEKTIRFLEEKDGKLIETASIKADSTVLDIDELCKEVIVVLQKDSITIWKDLTKKIKTIKVKP